MFSGIVVDDVLVGGPAWHNGLLHKGDVVLKINDIAVSDKREVQRLVSQSDQPGSSVVITVKKLDGSTRNVRVSRVTKDVMAVRSTMFELFGQMKVSCYL